MTPTFLRTALRTALPLLAALVALAPAGAGAAEPLPFANDSLLPKKETGAERFLADHPKYDGRGIVVAVYDTGIDPGAPGLQTTSDGKPKIVDVIDASGSGDVDTSTKREKDDDGFVEGLSGRKLKPAKGWKNPTGEWRVGVKPAYEIFPRGLVRRMREERGEDFAEAQRIASEAARRAVTDWDAAHPKPTRAELEEREDLVARVAQLESMGEDHEDPGPIFDCIVFHDGKTWRAAIDTDEDGSFDDETTLTNYRDERKWATFGDRDLMNYVLNIYDDGDLLSIVADAGAHGTHVAGIVAAHYPDRPERNGVAPGAQLVAVKIGDTRLGSTSVATGDVRGFAATLANGASLVNMSYGGASRMVDQGRMEELRAELVNEHGVIYVGSAGNEGPALSSVGGPGGTSTATIGVGAVVSPAMMAQQYSVREPYDELGYPWSSRGPAVDGWLGVDFSAPGAAIAPVPNWELAGSGLMNGTSMSSPNVCGSIALLLSGLKERGLTWTPHTIRRALAATARPLEGTDPWGQGAGVIRVDAAWDHLVANAKRDDAAVRYEVKVFSGGQRRGVYLRERDELARPFVGMVNVDPLFPEKADTRAQVAFEKSIVLETTADWIDAPDAVLLMHGGRSFEIRVDPTGLPPGAHFAQVRGIDAAAPGAGPLFVVPVTVVKPVPVTPTPETPWTETLALVPGDIERRFFAVPDGATWADVTMRRLDADTPRTLILHAVQLAEGESYADHGVERYVGLAEGEEQVVSFPLVGGRTLEIAFAQRWRSLGATSVACEVEFHGLVPQASPVVLDGGSAATPVDVTAMFARESIAPEAELTSRRRSLAPGSWTIRPLSIARDGLWDGIRMNEMVSEYEIELEEAGDYDIRPAVSMTANAEDDFQSMMWIVRDSAGKRLATGSGAEWRSVKLGKGKHRIALHVRHDDADLLKKIATLPLHVDRELGRGIGLAVLSSPAGATMGGDRFGSRELDPDERARMWIATPTADDLPDDAEPGDVLFGTITFGEEGGDRPGAGRRPDGWPVVMTVAPAGKDDEKAPEATDDEPEDERGPLDKLAETLRDEQWKALEALGEDEDDAFRTLASRIEADWPDWLPLWSARLARVDDDEGKGDTKAILAAADEVVARVDTTALAAWFGVKADDEPAAKKEAKEKKEVRDALRDALLRRARALEVAAGEKPDDAERAAAADAAWTRLERWADMDADEVADLRLARERRRGRLGVALELVNGRIGDADEPDRDLRDARLEILEALGWTHWVESERRALVVDFPPDKLVF